ncbi:helix-turn-helix domain-containing protein [Mycolicibacterium hippocampi]|uniref:helix-turn-helix domain-containing protein n=1 Tax=Mycolicibacterium hippocampi TaxID=659824 RepID=UPI0035181C56
MPEFVMPELMTVANVAEYINRSEATIRWWIATNTEIGPFFARIGKLRMARRAEIDRWIAAQFAA